MASFRQPALDVVDAAGSRSSRWLSYLGHSAHWIRASIGAMPYVAEAESVELVPDLWAMPYIETSDEARAALDRLADGYGAMTPSLCAHGVNRDHGRHE